jgi:hypothetical protein
MMDKPILTIPIRSYHCVHICVDFPMLLDFSLYHQLIPNPGMEECFEVIKRHTVIG